MKSLFSKMNVTSRMVVPFTICILLVMAISVIYSYVYLSKTHIYEIGNHAVTKAILSASEIDKLTVEVSSAVNVMSESVKMIDLTQNQTIHDLITNTLKVNNNIYGSTFALNPEAGYGKRSPYVYRIEPHIYDASDLIDSYDYEQELWFSQPKAAMHPTWSEPYFDEGGGNTLMVTYSAPAYSDSDNQFLGVMTGDIELDWLRKYLKGDQGQLFAFIIDRNTGRYVLHPNESYINNSSIRELSKSANNPQLAQIGVAMMNNQKGFESYFNEVDGKESFIAYCPTSVAEWSVAIVLDMNVMMKTVNHLRIMQVTIMFFGFLLFIILIIYIARSIKDQLGVELVELAEKIQKLARGEIVKSNTTGKIQYKKHSIADYVNRLSNNLALTVSFAQAIGKGDFKKEYRTMSDGDVLGNSLLEMSANLQKAQKEAEIQHEEERLRNWATEGLAKMGEFLRLNNDNLEELSYIIVSEMVKYTDTNQGGLFVLNDSDENNKFLELTACYAYDRKKFADKKVDLDEGLIGACFLEGESIYLTEIPADYLEITSGLGGDAPKALLLVPLKVNEQIYGVIELASFKPFEQYQIDFIEKVSESIASTLSNVKSSMVTQGLLEKSRLQTEELVNSQEEMRQTMEEMQALQDDMHRREMEFNKTVEQMNKIQADEDEIKFETKQFRDAIFETCNIVEFSPEGIIIEVNQNILKLFHTEKINLIGKHISDFISKEAANLAWNNIMRGKLYEDVQQVDAGNGKILTVKQKFMPLVDMHGNLKNVMLIAVSD